MDGVKFIHAVVNHQIILCTACTARGRVIALSVSQSINRHKNEHFETIRNTCSFFLQCISSKWKVITYTRFTNKNCMMSCEKWGLLFLSKLLNTFKLLIKDMRCDWLHVLLVNPCRKLCKNLFNIYMLHCALKWLYIILLYCNYETLAISWNTRIFISYGGVASDAFQADVVGWAWVSSMHTSAFSVEFDCTVRTSDHTS